MPASLAEQEARRDHLSALTGGGAVLIAGDYDNAADVTAIHHVSDGFVDAVWVQLHNSDASDVDVNVVLNPSDDTSTSAIDAATVTVTVPAKDSLWVLQGDSFRLRGSNTTAITAHVATADVDKVSATGYVVRVKGVSLY